MPEFDEKFIKDLKARVKDNAWRQNIHVPYEQNTGHPADFEIEYEFHPETFSSNYGLHQGIRTDFLYEGDDPHKEGINMIWPEFIDENDKVILDKTINIPLKGKALMWIGFHESRVNVHQKRIKENTKGYLVVGSEKLASVTVTKIIGLHENKS